VSIVSPISCAVAIVVGPVIGSFIGAATIRLPRGETIVHGRSRCDSCAHTLTAIELVPILSFVTQRGRCRHCQAPIARDQLFAELGAGGVALLAVACGPSIPGAVALALFGWVLLALALLDARHFWLPDALTLPMIGAGLLAVWVLPVVAIADRLLGTVVGYALLALMRIGYRRLRGHEGLGGGDAKLFAGIGAWLGIAALPWVMILAGLLGLAIVTVRRLRGQEVGRLDRLPLGTLLAVAALIVMPLILSGDGIALLG
jgi:leader peptidase (prepilin peptidase)/N-methyltransferase